MAANGPMAGNERMRARHEAQYFSVLARCFLMLAALLAAGCASQPAKLTDPGRDPWEPFNRKVHAFNDKVDRAILKPVARGYDAVMPDAPQRGVRNFFHNLAFPVTFLNLILQGKVDDSLTATGRFLVNSTIGLLGFFDVATREDIADFDEDFGQTLAVWGWKDSRYLVVPLLGPSTVRDLGGRPADVLVSPVAYLAREESEYRPLIVDIISLRASLLPFDEEIEAAKDGYVLVRDVYLQNREFRIYDGEPPAPDYDALLEE
jgi:phospholipid-binding lipoprotein MlaA